MPLTSSDSPSCDVTDLLTRPCIDHETVSRTRGSCQGVTRLRPDSVWFSGRLGPLKHTTTHTYTFTHSFSSFHLCLLLSPVYVRGVRPRKFGLFSFRNRVHYLFTQLNYPRFDVPILTRPWRRSWGNEFSNGSRETVSEREMYPPLTPGVTPLRYVSRGDRMEGRGELVGDRSDVRGVDCRRVTPCIT